MLSRVLALLPLGLLFGCGAFDEGALDVALIGTEESAYAEGLRLSEAGQLVRAATQSGLVRLDAQGEVVPALAERWIVTEDGRSFIFRLRDTPWPDGSPMTAESARDALLRAQRGLEGTSLGLDLDAIEDVRAMAGRVIEIRLKSPEPYLLNLLAQPELALFHTGGGTGPMLLDRSEEGARLDFRPPDERGLPEQENWREDVREVTLSVLSAQEATARFSDGAFDAVLGGDLGSLPLAETGPLSSGTLRIDATFGHFGLLVRSEQGLLSNDGVREGLAMAIDRAALLANYNVGGWVPTTRPVSPGLPGDPGLVAERWVDEDIADLRTEAGARIIGWRRQFGTGDLSQPAPVEIWMPEGIGYDRLFDNLADQFAQIGLQLNRAESAGSADLVLVDRVARYPAPRWFFNQLHCSLRRGLCSEEVDALVATALQEPDRDMRATLMAQAEAELTLSNVFIPIGSPLRWSLVRGGVEGFFGNPYAFHPLPDMAQIPR